MNSDSKAVESTLYPAQCFSLLMYIEMPILNILPEDVDDVHLCMRLKIARYHTTFVTDGNKDHTYHRKPWVNNEEQSKYC